MWPFKTKTQKRNSFPINGYSLNTPIGDKSGLKELTLEEYLIFIRNFMGEVIYKTPPVTFLNRKWDMMIGAVNDKIYKLNPAVVLFNKEEANEVAMDALNFCIEKLGEPVNRKTGFFIWDTLDGNVILQTGETAEGFMVSIFITSKNVRTFKSLEKIA